jgi:hypothetical protein
MWLKTIILVSLIAICGAADALKFLEEISVEGNGSISAKTTTDVAKDAVNGTGEQEYKRDLDLQEGATALKSEYHLTSNLQGKSNRYYAQMNSPAGLEHYISVTSASNIDSVSTISQSDYEVSTDYDIEANMAEMSEKITNWDNVYDDKTGNEIAKTEAYGNFSVKSELYDDGGVKKLTGFDPESMLNMLDAVEMSGEISEDKNDGSILFLYGELEDEVAVEIGKGVIPLGARTRYYQSEDETIGGRKIVFLGERPAIS